MTPQLYSRAYAGTKELIEHYVLTVRDCIDMITTYPTSSTSEPYTAQGQLNVLHDTRQAFGRSALVLQGGSIFGLCHLGVVRALHLRGLLPRVIAGTATGALIAALVGVHTDSELLGVLSGDGINIEAFTDRSRSRGTWQSRWYSTLVRRLNRLRTTGHFLDVDVLEEVLHANIGDMTFQEAFERTGRVLNITVSTGGSDSAPELLNHINAPFVVSTHKTCTYYA